MACEAACDDAKLRGIFREVMRLERAGNLGQDSPSMRFFKILPTAARALVMGVLACPLVAPAADGLDYSLIALGGSTNGDGDQPPGLTGPFDHFHLLDMPSIDAQGRVTFMGATDQGGTWGIWAGFPGALELVARKGHEAPGIGGPAFVGPIDPVIDRGRVCFTGNLDNSGKPNALALWLGEISPPSLAVREGGAAPGGGVFERFGQPNLLSDGSLAFMAKASGTTYDGVYVGLPGGLDDVLRPGQAAPGFSGGINIWSLDQFIAEPDGGISFTAVTQPGFDGAIYYVPVGSTTPTLVVKTDDDAPGTGKKFSNQFSYACVGADGGVAFSATIWGSGLTPDSASGVWAWKDGDMELAARGGETAPGTGSTFKRMVANTTHNAPVCDAHGRLAYFGLTTESRDGIWFGSPGALELVAYESAVTPRGDTWTRLEKPVVSPAGHVGFEGEVDLTEGGSAEGLWVQDIDGVLHTVVEEGDQLLIKGEMRTVSSARFHYLNFTEPYRLQPINAAGEFVYLVHTTDNHRALLLGKIPFPAAAQMLSLADEGGIFSVSINSRLGYGYQLEELGASGWADAGDAVVGTGEELELISTDTTSVPTRIFRVRISISA